MNPGERSKASGKESPDHDGRIEGERRESASKLKEVHEDKMENLANELKQMRSSLPDLQGMKLDFSASGLHEGKILVTAKEINFGYAEAGDLWPSPMSFQIKSGKRFSKVLISCSWK